MNYSAQGSITVKRLRTGDSLYITLELNGKPLYQGVHENGSAVPDWTVPAEQPVITPKVISARGNAVHLSAHGWSYNGVALVFSGANSSGWVTDSTGKFQMNASGALKIVRNLASKINIANDILAYQCIATVAGVEQKLTKSIDVNIQRVGATSYWGSLLATTEQLTETTPTATITAQLRLAAALVNDFHVKWYKDNEAWAGHDGQKQVTVTRADVAGSQLFIAEFFKQKGDTDPVFRAGLRILDTKDEYIVACSITSANKEVEVGKPVTVEAKIVNMSTGALLQDPASAKWRMDVMEKEKWTVLKTAAAKTIQVSTAETDRNGKQNDVEVVAEVEWS